MSRRIFHVTQAGHFSGTAAECHYFAGDERQLPAVFRPRDPLNERPTSFGLVFTSQKNLCGLQLASRRYILGERQDARSRSASETIRSGCARQPGVVKLQASGRA